MKKVLSILCAILTFFIMLPISYILTDFMLFWYQGNGFNGIFQFCLIIVLCIGISSSLAATVYKKIRESKNE
jgi:hypothetical protein